MMARVLVAAVVVAGLFTSDLLAQSQPPAPGRGIRAKDGDTILVEGNGKVKIVRRREADVRAIYNPAERWLILLADYAMGPQKSGDGGVDMTYTFHDVVEWPLGERWSGPAIVDDYLLAGEGPFYGVGLSTASVFVQLLSPADQYGFKDPAAVSISYRGSGRGGGGGQSMDITEAREIDQARRNAQTRANLPSNMRGLQSSMETGVAGGQQTAAGGIVITPGSSATMSAPVRVGGNVRQPQKIHHVEATMPEAAARAGVFGMVILEVVIGADGTVTDAKVLRSIPLLDKAAIDAVKQWRFEPTYLNGQPVPVILTVPVSFR